MTENHIQALKHIVGDKYVVTGEKSLKWFVSEYRGRYVGQALAAVRPANVGQVADIVKYCAHNKIPMVPQGGNTSLVGGAISYDPKTVIINLSRLNKTREIDADNFSMTVEAGVILSEIQHQADEQNLFFPLSIGSQGSCQIGGCISSNAGGQLTIGYGNTRDLVLGLEVVLPSGEIWHGLKKLRKDNTGYDLKHLFIGAEGTLGIVTAATLKLFSKPVRTETFMVGLSTPEHAVKLLAKTRSVLGESLMAFELMPRIALDFALETIPETVDPFQQAHAWYVIAELRGAAGNDGLRQTIEGLLAQALEEEMIGDAVFAESEAKRQQLWFIREAIVEAQRHKGGSIKHDISVPVSSIPAFLTQATQAVLDYMPDMRPVPFGHVGDGNIHFNITQPDGMDKAAYLENWDAVNDIVHNIVHQLGGSIAAEHGVGIFKAHELQDIKQPLELEMMATIKRVFDPNSLMNPGKILLTDA